MFISPFFIGYAVFFAYPVFQSLKLSFYRQSPTTEAKFVGFKNFKRLLSGADESFIQSIITIIGLTTWIIFPLIYWFEIINGWILILLIIITSILILMAFQKFEHREYKSRQDWEKWRDKNNK